MKVYERLAEAFKAEGTKHIFGMMGDGNMYWMHALAKLGVTKFEVRHEGAGLGMADGFARVTRTPGVATATCGPGVSQLATALLTASRARSPLVAFVGEHPMGDDEYNQQLKVEIFAAACETGFVRVKTPDSVDDMVRKAFYRARVESRPIMLSAPMDVQQKPFDDDEPYVPSTQVLTRGLIMPNPAALDKAVEIISNSKKPVIIVGRGAKWANAGDAVKKLAERTGAVIATTLMAKTWLNEDEFHVGVSGTYGTRTSMKLFEESDCVIAVGASLNQFTTEHGYLYPNAKFVHLDTQTHVIMGNGRGADCYVQTDARTGVEALESALAKRNFKATGYRTGEVRERLANAWEDRTQFDLDPGTVDPRLVITALDDVIPDTISLNTGSGATAGFSNILFRKQRPNVLAGHFYGCIGQMLPAAMGAIVATGNKPLVLVDGDASVMMHLAEFETAVRYNQPLLVVVMNNEMLGAEYYKLDVHKMEAEQSCITTPDLGAVAVAFGGRGKLARSVEDVRKAAAEWVAKPGPMMIDVRISRSVIPLPYRRIHYGKDE